MSSQPEQQPAPASPPLEGIPQPGEVLAGKYRVERVLGVGGMGVVVAAMHLHLGERAALKFLLPQAATPDSIERFAREARAAARIKSEHVARVTDVAQLETGATYMVMEFLEGQDLSEVVRESGPLPVRDAVEYVIQACDAIAEAHSMGIVHRDLKPANLFLARRPGAPARIKVLDFGISKITPQQQEQEAPVYQQRAMTHTRAWLGSPLYMAPEQMKSAKSVDARTDVWSLGVILFELLTGAVPFNGSNLPELCAEILHGKPLDVESKRTDVPREIGDAIRRCLEKDPARRFQNVAELVMALVDFAPRRARSVAERAVSLMEQAGMMRSIMPRAPLDSTLAGEGLMSPLRDSVAPPSGLRLEEPTIPRPPRTPSFAPKDTPGDVAQAATMVARPDGVTAALEGRRKSSVLVPILVVLTLLGSVGGTFYVLSHRAGAPPPEPAPSATASTPAATAALPAPAPTPIPKATATAAATAEAPPPPPEPPPAAPSVKPSASGKGRLPPARGSAAPVTTAAKAPAVAPTKAAPAPPLDKGGDLRIETCHETLPDGTRRVVPCPP